MKMFFLFSSNFVAVWFKMEVVFVDNMIVDKGRGVSERKEGDVLDGERY